MRPRPVRDAATFRRALIASGALVPREDVRLRDIEAKHFLPIDDVGRRRAAEADATRTAHERRAEKYRAMRPAC